MRIKGVSVEEAAPNVQQLYRKVAERPRLRHHPADRVRALPGDCRGLLGAGRRAHSIASCRAAAQDARLRARGADRGMPLLSGHQLCRGQRTRDH